MNVKEKVSRPKRGKLRIKFKKDAPQVSYRHAKEQKYIDVKLHDLSETGFSFYVNEVDEFTRVGDILFLDFKGLSGEESSCFTARIVRFHQVDDKQIFAAEFVSVTKTFKRKISNWAKLSLVTNYFQMERRSPISIVLRSTKKPIDWLLVFIGELEWRLENLFKAKDYLPYREYVTPYENLTNCIDFDQI